MKKQEWWWTERWMIWFQFKMNIICWKPFWRAYRSTSDRAPTANAQCTWTWRKQDLQRYIWIPDSDISEKISPICHSSTPQCDNSHSRHVTEIYVHTSSVTSQLTQLVFATKHNSYSHVPRGPCLFVSAKHRTALNRILFSMTVQCPSILVNCLKFLSL